MYSPDVGLPRAARALALVALVVGVSVVSHDLAGGHAPAGGVLAGLALLLLPFALVLTGRRLSPARVVGALALGQLAAHLSLSVLGGHPGNGAMCAPVTGHGSHLHHVGMQCDALAGPAAAVGTDLVPSLGMVLAHLLATAVLSGLVLRGESVLHAVVDLLLPRLVRLLHRPGLLVRPPAVAPAPLQPRLAWAPRSERGPPVLLAS